VNKINLEILPGSFVAIIGSSGSGKTTLVDLISGLLEPQLGSITFVDTKGNESPSHRQLVGYCSQNPYIFDSDVEENLRIAQTSIEPNSIQAIIDKLNLSSLSRTSHSKNEVSLSRRISGGERQRIGIARAFLSNRPILVFDEPTSALDKENASRFLEILEQNRGMTTQIVVTHDLQVAEKCDLLIVLDNGSIGYSGKPNDYLQTKS
jgi:ABC-type transport system involved in cytochrome bd biosynthesis fused ATPase/permease subunit